MRFLPGLLLVLATMAMAADKEVEPPKSPLVAEARRGYQQQVQWAQSQYDQAVAEARKKQEATVKTAQSDYITKLKAALDAALKGKNLEEANRIDAELKSAAAAHLTTAGESRPKLIEPLRPRVDPKETLADKLVGTTWRMRGSPRSETMRFVKEQSVVINRIRPDAYNEGVWVILDENTVRLTRPPLNGQVFKIDAKMRVLDSTSKDATFDRVD